MSLIASPVTIHLPRDVLAVVVSYCGRGKIAATVAALAPQVGLVYVVDNGSDAATLLELRTLQERGLIRLEELGTNTGLGHALNLGAQRAQELGFGWLLTMDQDSVPASDMVATMLAVANRPGGPLCLSPNIALHGSPAQRRRSGPAAYAITSGNLVHLNVWRDAGPYNEAYFIDCIDFDFSLRARGAGYVIHKESAAILHHELGQDVEMPSRLKRFYTQHSPLRRYYMFRNFLYLAKEHLRREPYFIAKLFVAHGLLLVLMLFYEPRLLENLRYVARGIGDFFRGRSGAYSEVRQ